MANLSTLLVLALVAHGCYALSAKKTRPEILAEKVSQMSKWADRRPVIKLNNDQFKEYLRTQPRNYSVIMMATALGAQHRCSICKQASDEFYAVASSYSGSDAASNRLFFAMADFDSAQGVFQTLQLKTVPVFYHFPAKGGKKNRLDQYDMGRFGFSAESLAKWVEERTDVHFKVARPPNYMMLIGGTVGVVAVLAIIYFKRKAVEQLISRHNCAVLSLFVILMMLSGQMWNQIRGAPMAQTDPNTGKVAYISGNSQFQFIAESYIIMAMYGLGGLGWILLSEQGPAAMKFSPNAQSTMIIAGVALVGFVFSWLLSTMRMKNRGYPYYFLMK
ncbi:magnesium transporter protein 1-like [Sycon ciliatum]|uniref:magnesium transporter protein 1-like n=1 Tax=Sycon ciliatum TaxID=27933 RepID=UPI0020A9A1C2|eukprot:scpid70270/ scgid32378/ Magnesium transporter protein 1; Implantation-associated protein